jgi:hypothetical protein
MWMGQIVCRPFDGDDTGAGGVSVGYTVRPITQDPKDIKKEDLLQCKVGRQTDSPDIAGLGSTPFLPIGTYVLCETINGMIHIMSTCGRPFGSKNYVPPGTSSYDTDTYRDSLDPERGDTQRTSQLTALYNQRAGGVKYEEPDCKDFDTTSENKMVNWK